MNITPEIQAHFDEIFNRRFAEVKAKIEARTPVPEELTELKTRLSKAYNLLRLAGIRVAAAELGAINAEQVAALLDGTVKVDDAGKLLVITPETGEARYSRDGTPLPLNEAVATFLTANPHMVKASSTTGSRRPDAFWGIFQNK